MILYTMMPQELIFPDNMEAYKKQQTILYQGVPLLVETSNEESIQIVRVLSTDPQHFLDERFTPGTKISFFNQETLSSF
ncbi:MAG: YlzJ-like family protein [Bacillota bacterium]|nr:YlzJ-like family protein [Bacillota bacterium]